MTLHPPSTSTSNPLKLTLPKLIPWPPSANKITNEFGIATLSLGNSKHHDLTTRLKVAAKTGYKQIDLFDECWADYLRRVKRLHRQHDGAVDSNNNNDNNNETSDDDDKNECWEATEENLAIARTLGDLVKSLGMRIACTQPLREIEGTINPEERKQKLDLVAKRFPFMRAFDTDLVFMCANIRRDDGVTSDLQTVASDLAELGDMAADYSRRDGGTMLKIGYEGLSWATRNTWASTWEVVRMANRENVGLIVDAFNVLAVEFADPYNLDGHGRVYDTIEESLERLCVSLASMVASVPGEKIFFVQLGDAELVDPRTTLLPFLEGSDSSTPRLLPWSRGHRLFPFEKSRGGYMPVELVAAAVIATGYKGPLSLEVFNDSLNVAGEDVPIHHAQRGIDGSKKLVDTISKIPPFWDPEKEADIMDLVKIL